MIYISIAECVNNHKSQHDTARSLLTSLLLALGYEDAAISKAETGRPYVNFENTDISISHSKNLVAVCVASKKSVDADCTIALPFEAGKIGIDIEYINETINLEKKNRLAKRFFSKEASSIEDFFCIWTENEAVGKMTGEGVIQKESHDCDIISFTVVLDSTNEEYSLSIAYSN